MSPKYKGGDWLDDEKSKGPRGTGRAKKKGKPAVGFLAVSEANGTVAEVFPNQCAVLADPVGDEPAKRYACTYRKAKLPNLLERDRAPVAVGDRVRMERISGTDGVVDGVCERRNELVRPAPMRATRHVLAANVDTLAIVAAYREPDFSPGLIDRFWVAAQAQGIETILCVSKMDLHAPGDAEPWKTYADAGARVILTCARGSDGGRGLLELRAAIDGKLTAFCGHSGVGKTSLLNALLDREVGRTGAISASTGKGQHTTTGAYLIPGTNLIDTPGIREFGLYGIAPERLRDYFPEFRGAACAEADCWHRDEEGCAVRALPRYGSYRRILESLIAGEN